jgi:hypothetical protein
MFLHRVIGCHPWAIDPPDSTVSGHFPGLITLARCALRILNMLMFFKLILVASNQRFYTRMIGCHPCIGHSVRRVVLEREHWYVGARDLNSNHSLPPHVSFWRLQKASQDQPSWCLCRQTPQQEGRPRGCHYSLSLQQQERLPILLLYRTQYKTSHTRSYSGAWACQLYAQSQGQ